MEISVSLKWIVSGQHSSPSQPKTNCLNNYYPQRYSQHFSIIRIENICICLYVADSRFADSIGHIYGWMERTPLLYGGCIYPNRYIITTVTHDSSFVFSRRAICSLTLSASTILYKTVQVCAYFCLCSTGKVSAVRLIHWMWVKYTPARTTSNTCH